MDGQIAPSKVIEKKIEKQQPVIKPMALDDEQHGFDDEDEDDDINMESVHDSDDPTDDMPAIFRECDAIEDEDEQNKVMIAHLMAKEELDQETVHNLDLVQKEELQRGIQTLDSDHFDPLVNMLQSFIPEGGNEDDEVELDVDSIDDALQVKMYNYMLQAIHQQEEERIRREGGNVPMNTMIGMQQQQQQQPEEEEHAQLQVQQQQQDEDEDEDE